MGSGKLSKRARHLAKCRNILAQKIAARHQVPNLLLADLADLESIHAEEDSNDESDNSSSQGATVAEAHWEGLESDSEGESDCQYTEKEGYYEDWRNVLLIVNAGTLAFEPGTVTRIGFTRQRSSIIDLVISGPGHSIGELEATIADGLRTGFDHEALSWELFSSNPGLSDDFDDSPTPAWKLSPPIKPDDKDKLKEWRAKWQSGCAPFEDPMIEIKRFTQFLDDELGRKRWSPHAKRWWNDRLDQERKNLSLPHKSQEYKTARAHWFK
jgi:hypothetical protein